MPEIDWTELLHAVMLSFSLVVLLDVTKAFERIATALEKAPQG